MPSRYPNSRRSHRCRREETSYVDAEQAILRPVGGIDKAPGLYQEGVEVAVVIHIELHYIASHDLGGQVTPSESESRMKLMLRSSAASLNHCAGARALEWPSFSVVCCPRLSPKPAMKCVSSWTKDNQPTDEFVCQHVSWLSAHFVPC